METATTESIESVYRTRGADFFRLALARTSDPELARDAVQEGFAHALRARAGFRGSGSLDRLHDYIAGPVIDSASEVEIRFTDGPVLRLPAVAAPASVGLVRFYAGLLPAGVSLPRVGPGPFPQLVMSIAGLDSDGNVVACLAPADEVDGVSPLAACR